MKNNMELFQKIEDLICNPPKHWRVLSRAIVNSSRNALLGVNRHGVVFLANTIANGKFGALIQISLKDVIPDLVALVNEALTDGNRRVVESMQVESVEYRV